MKTLHCKLLRDFKRTLGQVLAIASVIAGGITTFIMSLSTLDSLGLTDNTVVVVSASSALPIERWR